MAQVPIIRRKPEGEQSHLLSLTIDHPTVGGDPPSVNFVWDGQWVAEQGLPPMFGQQVLLMALQTLFAAGLVICGNVIAPPSGVKQN